MDAARARKFLRELADAPFVAFVMRDGETKIYAKGMTPDKLAALEQFAQDLMAAE